MYKLYQQLYYIIIDQQSFLTFQQTHAKVFLDRTDYNNLICSKGGKTTRKGYCKVLSSLNKDYVE